MNKTPVILLTIVLILLLCCCSIGALGWTLGTWQQHAGEPEQHEESNDG